MSFQVAPRLYEKLRLDAKLLRYLDQVGFVCFEETDECREELGLAETRAKLVCPDSGQVDEPLGASGVTKRCRKRGECNSFWVCWRIREQGLTFSRKLVGNSTWRRS